MIGFTFETDLNPIAVYAAVVSTVVLAWDIVKWRKSGARLHAKAAPDMLLVPVQPGDKRKFVVLTVTNRGNAATTITNVIIAAHHSPMHKWLRRTAPVNAVVLGEKPFSTVVPSELKTGAQFTCLAPQTDQIVGWSIHYWLYMGVVHSQSDRPAWARISAIKP